MRIYEDLRVVQQRLALLQSVLVVMMVALATYFWHLQVVRGHYYRNQAENNRSRIVPIAAPRGPLLDRHGRVLVENRASFNVVFSPEHVADLNGRIGRLSEALQIAETTVRDRVLRRPSPFRPALIKADASVGDVAAVEARRRELPEADVEVVPLRSYPLGAAAAHTLGRVGEVTAAQLQQTDFEDLQPGDLVGQAGIESQYNRALMGKDGMRRVIVNSRGAEVGEAERVSPVDGPSLTLTLDLDLQKAMEAAFGGQSGSAVALDPQTGEILAMTSTPAYDPNDFANGVDAAEWARLNSDSSTPLLNRVIQGQFAPGSLFKIPMATAALEEGVITPQTTFFCPGYLNVYGTTFHCHKKEGHGTVNVRQAIAQSCNVFFYNVGIRLEIERISRWAKLFGLGAPTGVDLPHEAGGLIPSAEWKMRVFKAPWYGGETVSVAIGQGQVSVTPLQMARVAAVVASGGRLVRPHLVRAVGSEIQPWEPPKPLAIRPSTLEVVKGGMWSVVNEQGTGRRAGVSGIEVCGKTGTAQVVAHAKLQKGSPEAIEPHGWFIGFAPCESPRIALAVLVEHGGSGGGAAAPVAHDILARFFGPAAGPETSAALRVADAGH